MPGIADSPNSLSVQPSAPSISQDTNITPAVGDFMKAFREGFITTDDITKRAKNMPLEDAQRQQALQDVNTIRPKQRANASKALDIQGGSLTAQAEAQPKLDAASISQAEEILGKAQRGNDKEAILNFYQTVANPGQLPPKLDPNDPHSDYDFAKIADENGSFLRKQRELQSATALGKFVKTFTVKEKTAGGGEKESVQRVNELTGEKIGDPSLIGVSAPQADVFRKEYNALPEVHDFRKVDAAFKKLNTALDDTAKPTPLRDMSAIFSWMKILDPGSTVREGEYATAKNAAGIPDKIMNFYNRALTGQILTPEQRKEMKEAAAPIFQAQVQTLAPQLKNYMSRESELGVAGQIVPPEDANLLKGLSGAATAPAGAAASSETPVKVNSPAEAPPTAKFIQAPDGRVFKNPNYKP
jgi:hypothetical protein